MIQQSEVAKALAYASKNHGYTDGLMYIKTLSSYNHTVVSGDDFAEKLGMAVPINVHHGINVFGNIENYDATKFMIPIAKRYYLSTPFDIMVNANIRIPVESTHSNFRRIQVNLIDLTENTEDELYTFYYTPQPPSGQSASVPIRAHIEGNHLASVSISNAHDYAIGFKFLLRVDDIFVNAEASVRIFYHA